MPAVSVRSRVVTSLPASRTTSAPAGSALNVDVQVGARRAWPGSSSGGRPASSAGQRNQAVQSAAVEQVPAQPVRDPARDRALARPAGSVDRHHENRLGRQLCHPRSGSEPTLAPHGLTSEPILVPRSRGRHGGRSRRTRGRTSPHWRRRESRPAPWPRKRGDRKAHRDPMIADGFRRLPPVRRPPSIRIPSGRALGADPERCEPTRHRRDPIRFLDPELRRPAHRGHPARAGGGHEERRQLVDRERHQPRRRVDHPRSGAGRTSMSATGSGTTVPMVDQAQIGAHQRQHLEQPCARRIDTDPLDDGAARHLRCSRRR